MNLEIHKPELVRRVNAQIQSRHLDDAEELPEQARRRSDWCEVGRLRIEATAISVSAVCAFYDKVPGQSITRPLVPCFPEWRDRAGLNGRPDSIHAVNLLMQ
jgi:hypothetical protein